MRWRRWRHRKNRFEPVIERNWGRIPYTRAAFVNAAVARVIRDGRPGAYLEIGCDKNFLFRSVFAADKVGVDPESGGTVRMTSDAFFAQNDRQFDVVFVDGLHEYGQCQRDAINALNAVPVGGFILFHDFMPTRWMNEHVPRLKSGWSGDVWKVAFELMHTPGVEFIVADADHGVGIAYKAKEQVQYVSMAEEIGGERFPYFYEHYQSLPLRDAYAALDFIAKI